MKRSFDTIVLGCGGLGSAALYWLSTALGGEVLGPEQFATATNGAAHMTIRGSSGCRTAWPTTPVWPSTPTPASPSWKKGPASSWS